MGIWLISNCSYSPLFVLHCLFCGLANCNKLWIKLMVKRFFFSLEKWIESGRLMLVLKYLNLAPPFSERRNNLCCEVDSWWTEKHSIRRHTLWNGKHSQWKPVVIFRNYYLKISRYSVTIILAPFLWLNLPKTALCWGHHMFCIPGHCLKVCLWREAKKPISMCGC